MKPQSFSDRLTAGLVARGWTKIQDPRSSRYLEFSAPGKPYKFFVGKNGALRQGKNASASHSVGCPSSQSRLYRWFLGSDASLEKMRARVGTPQGWSHIEDGGSPAETTDASTAPGSQAELSAPELFAQNWLGL